MCINHSTRFYTDMKQKYALNNKNAEYAAFGKKLHRCAERTKIARRRCDGGRLFMGCVGAWRLVASHAETRGFMRHEELLAAPHRVIPAQAGIQVCPQRTAG